MITPRNKQLFNFWLHFICNPPSIACIQATSDCACACRYVFRVWCNVLEDYEVSNQNESTSLPFCNMVQTYCLSCARIGETGQVRYASRVGRLLCWGARNTKWKFIKHNPPHASHCVSHRCQLYVFNCVTVLGGWVMSDRCSRTLASN